MDRWLFYGNDIAIDLKPIFAFPRLANFNKTMNALQVHVDKEDKTSYLIQVSGTKYEAKTIFLNESGLQLTKVRIEKTGNMVSTWNVTLLHRYNVTLSIFLYAKISIEGVIILLYIIYILYIIVL